MNKKNINLVAYDNFERFETFKGNLDAYRKAKIKLSFGHISFIKNFFPRKKIKIIELGSGNSRTLFALEKAGVLKKGYGLEVSKSRHQFAELWKNDWKFKRVENININALRVNFDNLTSFDLCFCADQAFQFFEPAEKGSALKILKNVYKNLNSNGKVILELDGYERIISRLKNNNVRLWEDFPRPDPWKYSLWDCSLDPNNKFLTWKRIYIKRDFSEISESIAIMKIYRKEEIKKIFREAGFTKRKVNFYADWQRRKFKDETHKYIIVATK